MGKVLDSSAVRRYRDDGIHFPVDALTPQQAADNLLRLQAIEAADGGRLNGRTNQKPHLLFPWLDQLIRHPRILDAVEDLYGPNLFCWSAQFFAKNPGEAAYVSWHQDATYWGLSSPDVVTAWVAFTPSTPANGCMRVVPGTHKSALKHDDTFAEDNLLSRGQEIAVKVDPAKAVDVILQPGQVSLHNVLIVHGSEPNQSVDQRRVGFAIRYVPTHVHQTSGVRESAMLVRGVDEYHHFDHEIAPLAEMHPEAVARHKAIVDRQLKILYAGASKPGKLGGSVAG